MQNRARIFSFLGSRCRKATIVTLLLAFLTCSICAQTPQQSQECEHIYTVAVRAEQDNDPIEAELRYEECRELAQKYRLPKSEAAAIHRLAVIRARNKKFTESANLFRRGMTLDPKNPMILCDFAQLYADRKDYNEAEILLKKALDLDPNNPKVLFSLGSIIASQRGERQIEGLRYMKLAVGEAEAYRELARIYHSKGDIHGAEFAEQRAKEKLSEGPPATAYTLTVDKVPAVPTATQQTKTPPEVVNRVRQELVDAQTRKTIAEVHRQSVGLPPAAPLIAQAMPMPTPVAPSKSKTAAVILPKAEETASASNVEKTSVKGLPPVVSNEVPTVVAAASPQQQPTENHPVDPFDLAVRPMTLPQDPFGQPVPLEVRTLTSQHKPLSDAPQVTNLDRDKKTDTISLVRVQEKKPALNPTLEPSLVKIASSNNRTEYQPKGEPLPRIPVIAEKKQQTTILPAHILAEDSKRVTPLEKNNPLRQIPPGGAGLVDLGAETSEIAVLPTFSAVGAKKIAGVDKSNTDHKTQNNAVPPIHRIPNTSESSKLAFEQPKSAGIALEPLQTATKKVETVRLDSQKKDVDVLQSPSEVIARRDLPMVAKSNTHVSPAETRTSAVNVQASVQKSGAAHPISPTEEKAPEYARIVQSSRRFNSTNVPAVLKFGAMRPDPIPESQPEKLVAIIPKAKDTETQAQPLMIVKSSTDTAAQTNIAPPADPFPTAVPPVPFVVTGDPFAMPKPVPQIADATKVDPQESALPALPAAPSISVAENSVTKPKFGEVKKIELQMTPLPEVPAATSDPVLIATETMPKPKFGAIQKIEPRVPVVPAVISAPPDSFLAANENPAEPKFVDVTKKPEPLPPVTPPQEMPKLAANDKPVVPKLVEIRKPESLPPVTPPQEMPKLAANDKPTVPKLVEIRKPEPLPPVAPPQEMPKLAANDKPAVPKLVEIRNPESLPPVTPPQEMPKLAANDKPAVPKLVEIRKPESLPPVAPPQEMPKLAANDKPAAPKLVEIRKPESLPPVTPPQEMPKLAANDKPAAPKLVEIRKPESLPPVTPPQEMPKLAANDKPAVPKYIEVKKPEPMMPQTVLPIEVPKLAEIGNPTLQQPLLVKESMTTSQPPSDVPTGFASTRKKAPKVAAEDQTMGFARSKR